MSFFAALGLVLVGLALLVAGGEILLRGAVGLATICRLTPAVIGLTVVAAGTSVPELAVSGLSAISGKTDIAVGNVVGSNIFNIAFILGIVALYRRLTLSGNTIKLEYPVLFLTTALFVLFAKDGEIGRLEALFFLIAYVCFTAYLVRLVRSQLNTAESEALAAEVNSLEPVRKSAEPKLLPSLGLLAAGVGLLGWGADWAVEGAAAIGAIVGLSERVIGLTIVAGGTGLPELVTSLVSSYRGRDDIAIANVIGSNIFNILCILGLTSLISPLSIAPEIISSDNIWMMITTILLFPIMVTGLDITKREGGFLLGVYLVYLVQLLVRA